MCRGFVLYMESKASTLQTPRRWILNERGRNHNLPQAPSLQHTSPQKRCFGGGGKKTLVETGKWQERDHSGDISCRCGSGSLQSFFPTIGRHDFILPMAKDCRGADFFFFFALQFCKTRSFQPTARVKEA